MVIKNVLYTLCALLSMGFIPALGSEVAKLTFPKASRSNKDVVVRVVVGDITEQKVDYIVNAANTYLRAGTGVCGAIFAAAGKDQLIAEIDKIKKLNKEETCPVGQVRWTGACDLQEQGISQICHAVGPDCRVTSQKSNRKSLLESVLKNCLEKSSTINPFDRSSASIALPSISTGVYEYPIGQAAQVTINTIVNIVNKGRFGFHEVLIVLYHGDQYLQQQIDAYQAAMEPYQSQQTQLTRRPNNKTVTFATTQQPVATAQPATPTAQPQSKGIWGTVKQYWYVGAIALGLWALYQAGD